MQLTVVLSRSVHGRDFHDFHVVLQLRRTSYGCLCRQAEDEGLDITGLCHGARHRVRTLHFIFSSAQSRRLSQASRAHPMLSALYISRMLDWMLMSSPEIECQAVQLTRQALLPRNVTLLRAVVREDLSMSMADELVKDIARAIDW